MTSRHPWIDRLVSEGVIPALVDRLPFGVYVIDVGPAGELVISGANEGGRRRLRAAGADLGDRLDEVLTTDVGRAIVERHRHAAQHRTPMTFHIPFESPGGRARVAQCFLVPFDGRILGVAFDVSNAVSDAIAAHQLSSAIARATVNEERLRRRTDFDALVAEISRHLLMTPASAMMAAVEVALSRVATHLGAHAATLARTTEDGAFERRVVWRTPELESVLRIRPERIAADEYPWSFARVEQEGSFVTDVAHLPPQARRERTVLERLGVTTLAMAALRTMGAFSGYVTLLWFGRRPDEPDEMLAPLRTVADVLSAELDRARADLARETAEARLRLVFDALDDAVIVTDSDDVVVAANRATAERLGIPLDQLIGRPRPASTIYREDGTVLPHLEQPTTATLRDGRPRTGVVEGWDGPDGTRRWVSVNTRTLTDEGEGRHLVVSSFRDITEHRHLMTQLAQTSKMESLGRLAGGIAHDLNNILTVISGYTALLLAEMGDDDPIRADLQEIEHAAERAATLVDQLLSFSRRQMPRSQSVDLNEVVVGMRQLIVRLVPADIHVELAPAAEPAVVRCDRSQLEQVVLNLVVNAGDAMPEGGELRIGVQRVVPAGEVPPATAFVVLSVSDTGVGMDDATLASVFDPFFTTKPGGQGTGLGLSTVYGIVTQAGGHIRVESRPGSGSTFCVYLPEASAAPDAVPARPVEGEVRGGNETVMVVEDDAAVRKLAAATLERLGYRVLSAPDGASARELARRHQSRIDLLVTDVVLPDARGDALARELRASRPGMRVLVMSGYAAGVVAPEAAELEFVPKPFAPDTLARRAREVLDAP